MGIGFSARALLQGLMGGRARSLGRARHWHVELFRGMEELEGRVMLTGYVISDVCDLDVTTAGGDYGLTVDSNGNLFGTTTIGGTNVGEVFEVAAGTKTATVLDTFDRTDGQYPSDQLIQDGEGNIFGTAFNVFEVKAGSGAITQYATVDQNVNSSYPIGGVIMDSGGDIYGVARFGGDKGGVFEIPAGTQTIEFLASFPTYQVGVISGLTMDEEGNLYGTTTFDGSNPSYIFELPKGGQALEILATFGPLTSQSSGYGVVVDGEGNIFGVTNGGGADNQGCVFELAAGSHTIMPLISFDGTNGERPDAGLTMDASGNIFGTTGGDRVYGTVFEIPAGTTELKTLATFNGGSIGYSPQSPLVLDSHGDIFGAANYGGANGRGTIFELSPSPATQLNVAEPPADGTLAGTMFTVAVSIDDAEGNAVDDHSEVTLRILSGPDGASLPGVTTAQAVNGVATFPGNDLTEAGTYTLEADDDGVGSWISEPFEVVAGAASQLTFLQQPTGGVAGSMETSDGMIAVEDAWGNVVKADGESILLSLQGTTGNHTRTVEAVDGIVDLGADTLTVAGTYSIAASVMSAGVTGATSAVVTVTPGEARRLVFGYEPGWTPSGYAVAMNVGLEDIYGNLVSSADGSNVTVSVETGPAGGVMSGTETEVLAGGITTFNNVFLSAMGTYTLKAVEGDFSTVSSSFEITGTLTVLGAFNGGNGKEPIGKLVMDSAGNLYGTTTSGGANGDGTVYEIAKESGFVTTLATFDGDNGAMPYNALVRDKKGNLFGTTSAQGGGGYGTIFEIRAGSGIVTTLASFNGVNGSAPEGGLVMDSAGNLYGTTTGGGQFNVGEVFEMVKSSGQLKVLSAFDGSNGALPLGDIVLDSAGNIYGTTYGLSNQTMGDVFEIAKGSRTISVLKAFNASGSAPYCALTMDKRGDLFGTTGGIDRSDSGTIFEISKGGTFTTLAAFDKFDGSSPEGGLLIDSSGNLFGTALEGGVYGYGGIYELAAGSSHIQLLTSFNAYTEGAYPTGTLITDGHGKLLGTTYGSGIGGEGTVYSYDASSFVAQGAKLVLVKGTSGFEVEVVDAHGKIITNGSYGVTLSLTSAPKGVSGAVGPTTKATIDGVANFEDEALPAVNGNYIFSATNWGLGTVTLKVQVKKAPKVKAVKLGHG